MLESLFAWMEAQAIYGSSPYIGPIVNLFQRELGADTLLLGWGLDDDNTHSPNEKFSLADFHRGIKASAYLWEELSRF